MLLRAARTLVIVVVCHVSSPLCYIISAFPQFRFNLPQHLFTGSGIIAVVCRLIEFQRLFEPPRASSGRPSR
jgi:hypothetical protein